MFFKVNYMIAENTYNWPNMKDKSNYTTKYTVESTMKTKTRLLGTISYRKDPWTEAVARTKRGRKQTVK